MSIRIFLFHRVHPKPDPLWMPMSPRHFERVIAYIKKHFTVIALEAHLAGDVSPANNDGRPLAAIVFDDGYMDFKTYALPILRQYECPASMYVVTKCVESGRPIWTYALDHAFMNSTRPWADFRPSVALPNRLLLNLIL